MKVLVSGAHGLIGGALVHRLADEGHQVVTLDRPGSERRSPSGRAAGVGWDPGSGTLDRDALQAHGPYDAAAHLAGAGIGDRRWTTARRQVILRSRVDTTRLLATELAGLDRPPPVLVSASAVGVYGDRGDEELTEDSDSGEGFLAEVCRQWEAATQPAVDAGIRVVTLRSGIVLSPTGGALGRQLPLFRLGLGARLGDGRQYVSWITLTDEVAVLERTLTDDALRGPVNATAPAPVTNAAFTQALGRAVHRPALLRAPRPALALLFGADMADEMLLAGQRVLPARLAAAGQRFAHPDIDTALPAVLAGR